MSRRKWVAVALGRSQSSSGAAIVRRPGGSRVQAARVRSSSSSSFGVASGIRRHHQGRLVNSAPVSSAGAQPGDRGATTGRHRAIKRGWRIGRQVEDHRHQKDDGSDVAKASAASHQLIQQGQGRLHPAAVGRLHRSRRAGIEEKGRLYRACSPTAAKGHENEHFSGPSATHRVPRTNADALVKIFARRLEDRWSA